MLASILSKVSPMISRAATMQPSAMVITRDMATKTNKTAKLKAKLKASAYSHLLIQLFQVQWQLTLS